MKFPKLSNTKEKRQTPSGDKRQFNADGAYARLRRLEATLTNIEAQLSTLRRDVNRIDRANNRSTVKAADLAPQENREGIGVNVGGSLWELPELH